MSSSPVREGQPGSHKELWSEFTDRVISLLNEQDNSIVFALWGNFAKSKKVLITKSHHLVLEAGHPSPLSVRLFSGCKHFSKINNWLRENNKSEINWQI